MNGIWIAVGLAAFSPSTAQLDSLLTRAWASNAAPGLAIAVVEGDRIAWQGTRGWADREERRPVTEDTRFYIASTTKALTATAAASLAARGALDLEMPLSRALPHARFHPAIHADSIRVVDLLTHTHGISTDGPVSTRIAYTGDYSYEDLYRGLATQGPAEGGRAFEYSNLGYDLAGIVLDPSRKGGWKRVVEREVLEPLGMTSTTAYRSKLKEEHIAVPYAVTPDGFGRIRLAKEDANMGPAGGMFSTAGDLARLVRAELNGGLGGVTTQTQRFRVPQSRKRDSIEDFGWGLGWDLGTFDGDTLVHRFGTFPGYACHVSFMPTRRIGVVVLVNNDRLGMGLADVLADAVYDAFRGRPDAAARLAEELDSLSVRVSKTRGAVIADRARRAARSQRLPHPLVAYAGDYRNEEWGTLRLRVQGGRLVATMGVARSDVEVYDAATNKLRVELFGSGDVLAMRFPPGADRPDALVMEGVEFRRR